MQNNATEDTFVTTISFQMKLKKILQYYIIPTVR